MRPALTLSPVTRSSLSPQGQESLERLILSVSVSFSPSHLPPAFLLSVRAFADVVVGGAAHEMVDVFDGVDNDALMIDDCNGARLCLSRCLPVSLLHATSVGIAERSVGTEKPDQVAGRERACVDGAR